MSVGLEAGGPCGPSPALADEANVMGDLGDLTAPNSDSPSSTGWGPQGLIFHSFAHSMCGSRLLYAHSLPLYSCHLDFQ